MSRFRKLSHTIWHCQYHLVRTPKYRCRILESELAQDVEACLRGFSKRFGCEVIEINVQLDHVHLLAMVPPKVSIPGRYEPFFWEGTVLGYLLPDF